MPTYEYECSACRRVFEIRQRITEPPLTTCEECGGSVHRLLSAAPFILKGEGWYVTDYPSESRKKALSAEKSSASAAAPAASDKSDKSDGAGKSEKSEKSDKSDKSEKSDKLAPSAKSDGGAATSSGASSSAAKKTSESKTSD